MTIRAILPILVALLLLPSASASPVEPEETQALAEVVSADTVRIAAILTGEDASPGDLLPVCPTSPIPPQNWAPLLGSIHGGCFQASAVYTEGGCQPAYVTLFGTEGPVGVKFDERCFWAHVNELLGGGFQPPVRPDMILWMVYE